MYSRNCPQCKKELSYSNIKNRNQAEKHKLLCKDCFFLNKKHGTLINKKQYNKRKLTNEQVEYIKSIWSNQDAVKKYVRSCIEDKKNIALKNKNTPQWERICPKCNNIIVYTLKQNRDKAEKDKTICSKCSNKILGESQKGENNPFFGKKHSVESMNKMKETSKKSEKRKKFLEKIRGKEYKKDFAERFSGENNPRYGKGSLYDIWLKKYGKVVADEKNKEYKKKLSLKTSGKNNNMYGKPSPQGSGNGWSGWYKNWHFRSVHELSYMINIIEKNNLKWESAEKRKYMIKYIDFKGEKRNYFADFLINDIKLVEVKPEKLKKAKTIILKCSAARKFCKKNGYTFEITTPPILTNEELKVLYLSGEVKFIERYEEKFKKRFNL